MWSGGARRRDDATPAWFMLPAVDNSRLVVEPLCQLPLHELLHTHEQPLCQLPADRRELPLQSISSVVCVTAFFSLSPRLERTWVSVFFPTWSCFCWDYPLSHHMTCLPCLLPFPVFTLEHLEELARKLIKISFKEHLKISENKF